MGNRPGSKSRPRPAKPAPLRRRDLPCDTLELSRYLIGKTLVHDLPEGRLAGRIVETEAYPVGDAAAHSFRGQTVRNRSLFLERGHSYVYFAYGSCWMMNVSSESAGVGAGVLIRALDPVEGIDIMQRNRRVSRSLDLTRGPGRLAQAMRIDKSQDGLDLCSGGRSLLWLGSPLRSSVQIGITTRIGLSREAHRQYRFFEVGNPFVSGPRRLLLKQDR